MKVAIVFTGQIRYMDWCYQWWKSVAEESEHDIDFFSSSWAYSTSHSNNISFANSANRIRLEKLYDGNLEKYFDDVKFIFSEPAELQKYFKFHKELNEYLTPPEGTLGYSPEQAFIKFQYYFGRLYHLSQAVNQFDLSKYDKLVHSRWDCLVKPKHFDRFIDKGWRFSAVVKDPDPINPSKLLHSNDFLYSGDTKDFIKNYKDPYREIHFLCDKAKEIKQTDWITGSKYIIGHCLFVNHINDRCRVIHNIKADSTLFRNYELPFKYDNKTFESALYIYGVDIDHIRDKRLKKNKVFQ